MSKPRLAGGTIALCALGALFATYAMGYFWARATHRLVNYGTFVAGPNATRGIGFTTWEVVFVPATELEAWVRRKMPG